MPLLFRNKFLIYLIIFKHYLYVFLNIFLYFFFCFFFLTQYKVQLTHGTQMRPLYASLTKFTRKIDQQAKLFSKAIMISILANASAGSLYKIRSFLFFFSQPVDASLTQSVCCEQNRDRSRLHPTLASYPYSCIPKIN